MFINILVLLISSIQFNKEGMYLNLVIGCILLFQINKIKNVKSYLIKVFFYQKELRYFFSVHTFMRKIKKEKKHL